jgi:hypothetical protein
LLAWVGTGESAACDPTLDTRLSTPELGAELLVLLLLVWVGTGESAACDSTLDTRLSTPELGAELLVLLLLVWVGTGVRAACDSTLDTTCRPAEVRVRPEGRGQSPSPGSTPGALDLHLNVLQGLHHMHTQAAG